jgi:hypothetical protein
MDAIHELSDMRNKLENQIRTLKSELEAVEKTIQLLKRENATTSPRNAEDKSFSRIGLTEACRKSIGDEWISPSEIREQLLKRGFKTPNKAKLLNAVFATLRRLAAKGEFEGQRIDGKLKYRKVAVQAAAA